MEPDEFKQMVDDVRNIEHALGKVTYQLTDKQKKKAKEDPDHYMLLKI